MRSDNSPRTTTSTPTPTVTMLMTNSAEPGGFRRVARPLVRTRKTPTNRPKRPMRSIPSSPLTVADVAGEQAFGAAHQRGTLGVATARSVQRAAGVEVAPGGQVGQVGDLGAAQRDAVLSARQGGVGFTHGRDQGLGVGMLRVVDDLWGGALFHDLAEVHHGDLALPGE